MSKLIEYLKENRTIKYLNASNISWNLETIKSFAEFLKDLECQITSINFSEALNHIDKVDILLDALEINNTVENVKISHNYLGDKGLKKVTDVLSKKFIKVLEIRNTNIRLEDETIIDKFSKFLKNANINNLDISDNPILPENLIKLLKNIKETNIVYLSLDKILFDNNHIPALCSFIRDCKLAELYFSLSDELNEVSKNKLSDAIASNEGLKHCISGAKGGMSFKNKKNLNEQIDRIEQNKYMLKDVAEFLKGFHEAPNNRVSGDILYYYLKLYSSLNKERLKEELEKLGVTEVSKVFESVDHYLSIIGQDAAEVNE